MRTPTAKPALLLVLVAVGLVAAWLLQTGAGPAPRTADPPSPDRQAEQSGPQPDTDAPLPARLPAHLSVQADDEPATGVEASAAEPASAEFEELLLHGTVVVLDSADVAHPRESGTLDLILWQGSATAGRTATVEEGRYSIGVLSGVEVTVRHLVLGGVPATVEGSLPQPIPLPEDGRLDLLARWSPALVLRVLGEDTGADLDEVQVWTDYGWDRSRAGHPRRHTAGRWIVEVEPSPIALPPDRIDAHRPNLVVYGRSPGYAWGRIELDLARGGEQVLTLLPGGALDVTVVGDVPPGALLRVRPGTGSSSLPHAEYSLDDERSLAVESVAVGPYDVSLEIGEWWREPLSLGRVRSEVRAGERTPVALILEPVPEPQAVPLRGVVVLPGAWEKDRCLLVVHLLDVPLAGQERIQRLHLRGGEVLEGGDRLLPFDAGLLQPGLYELEVFEPPCPTTLELGPEGLTDVRLEVPPPATVAVQVVDAVTGLDVGVRLLHWHPVWPDGVFDGGAQAGELDPESGRHEFTAPVGPIEISLQGHDVVLEEPVIELQPGHNELTLRSRRRCAIRVVVAEGGQPQPWKEGWRASAREVHGEGRSYGQDPRPPGVRLTVPHPGLYLVEIEGLEEYRAPQPLEVDVPYGELVECVVSVERSP